MDILEKSGVLNIMPVAVLLSLLKCCTSSHRKRTMGILGPGLVLFHFQHSISDLLCLLDFCIPLIGDCLVPLSFCVFVCLFVIELLVLERGVKRVEM